MNIGGCGIVSMIGRTSGILVAVLLLVSPVAAHAGPNGSSDPIIGLLELPQLFGRGECDRYEVQALALYEAADSDRTIGEVRVDRSWSFPANGGCVGRAVGVHMSGAGAAVQKLPTGEYGYEEPGAIVLARDGNRYRIELQEGAAWVEPMAGARFHSFQELVSGDAAYLTASWTGFACARPGDSGSCRKAAVAADSRPAVKVLGYREVRGRLWFELEFPVRDACGEPPPAVPPIRSWVPAYGETGKPAVWFHSRGC